MNPSLSQLFLAKSNAATTRMPKIKTNAGTRPMMTKRFINTSPQLKIVVEVNVQHLEPKKWNSFKKALKEWTKHIQYFFLVVPFSVGKPPKQATQLWKIVSRVQWKPALAFMIQAVGSKLASTDFSMGMRGPSGPRSFGPKASVAQPVASCGLSDAVTCLTNC